MHQWQNKMQASYGKKKALLKGKEINKPLWTIEPQVREPVRR